ncbi:uncharacterized protein LOC124807853 isoform X1 [Hydra vulgaris]|uniref:uncharacterized protein LOC124807853 isoform X1 n=1 Tax=Hydra vulgaris TaxID=6087 RepID=UPI0032EA1FB2
MDYKRSLKRRHVSPTKRLFSTIVIEEDGADTKTVVPSHWVDPCKSIVFYPPRGRKTVAVYLSEWAEPEVGWQEFKLIEYILEAGSYETCHAMLMFQTEDKDDDVPISKKFEIIVKERVASPKLKLGGIKIKFQYLDEHDDVSSSNKFEVKEREKVDSFLDPVASTPSKMIDDDNRDSCKCVEKLRKIGDGGVSFKEMPNKQFQYALFMDIQKNFRQIQDTQAQILDRLKNIEQSGDVDFSLNVDDIEKEPISSIERFDIIENMLKTSTNARKRKVTQIRAVGGATPRKTIKNVLNAVMTQGIQALFSKDGRKGKRKFTDTAHYKCIKEVVVGDKIGYDASSIEGAIGDILKRAKK